MKENKENKYRDNPFFLDRIQTLEDKMQALEKKTHRLKWLWILVAVLTALILFYVVYPIIVHFYYVAQG